MLLQNLLCVCVRRYIGIVNGQCRETLFFTTDTSLATLEPTSLLWRLQTLIYDLDPWPEILLVTSLTHNDKNTHTCPRPAAKHHFINGVIFSLACLDVFGQAM